jgi:hypothetical protein
MVRPTPKKVYGTVLLPTWRVQLDYSYLGLLGSTRCEAVAEEDQDLSDL